jgi:hypothetical protein
MPFKNLFSDFFYRLSFSFNRAETSSFAHPVQYTFCYWYEYKESNNFLASNDLDN